MIFHYITTYCKKSTINSLKHVVAPNYYTSEKLLWSLIIFSAMTMTILISYSTITRFLENPTVSSIDLNHLNWNTTFPSLTICPTTKLNELLLEQFVEFSTIKNKTGLKTFLVALAHSNYQNFHSIPVFDDVLPELYTQVLGDLQFELEATVKSTLGEEIQYEKIISEMGICYTVNSIIARYNSPNYWDSGIWEVLEPPNLLEIDAFTSQVKVKMENISSGFEVYFHGPYDVADISSKKTTSPNGYFLQLYLTGLTLFSSPAIKNLGIKQRKCRFHYESNLRHSPVYSYVLCRMECRASLAQKLCGCIPHFYRKLDGDKVCGVTGLHCLARFKERLILLRGECQCMANCDEVNYTVEDSDTREWFLGSNLQWGLKEYPKMRLRRDVLFGFSDLLVYTGGMAGLFLGCSVLSFMEIIYFFTLRLYWFIVKYPTKKTMK